MLPSVNGQTENFSSKGILFRTTYRKWISAYTVDSSTGALTSIAGSPFALLAKGW